MQEVCSSIDANQLGGQIKSESTLNTLHHQTMQAKLINNCDKRIDASAYWMNTMPPTNGGGVGIGVGVGGNGINMPNVSPTESGFINSQPSMAEFMTHIDPDSPKMMNGTPNYNNAMQNDQCDVPEYPWMKEKKTARKNSNNSQGKLIQWIRFLISFHRAFLKEQGKEEKEFLFACIYVTNTHKSTKICIVIYSETTQ